MNDEQIKNLADDLAERLTKISNLEKQKQLAKLNVTELHSQIKLLNDEIESLEQQIHSERYIIAEKLGQPEEVNVQRFKKP